LSPCYEKIRTVETLAEDRIVAYLVEIPVEGGGVLRVQAAEDDIPAGLGPAARRDRSGQVVVKAKESVQAALSDIEPAIAAATRRLRALAADELTVEFGLVLGVEGGAVVAKGSAEVHFTVTLSWKKEAATASGATQESAQAAAPQGGQAAADAADAAHAEGTPGGKSAADA
jgi:hypothetical protein